LSQNSITIDVEDWFHILDSSGAPTIDTWDSFDSRVDIGMNLFLDLLAKYSVRATLFWLGWMAERNKDLVKRCLAEGHEVASHGYGHVLAYQVGHKVFSEDIARGKRVLEDILEQEVKGFRAPGFGITQDTPWAFDEIKAAGYTYDSSVFPTSRGHGGIRRFAPEPQIVETAHGSLFEIPQSVVEIGGKRMSLFGGGYLRMFPKWMIRIGISHLQKHERPLVIYVHPREVDPGHPRLPLGLKRSFKSYHNLKSTLPKLEWLCQDYEFVPMCELVEKTFEQDKRV